jgi:hypothetical protein
MLASVLNNDTFGAIDSVERADQALSHGIGADLRVDISPLVDNLTALNRASTISQENHRATESGRALIGQLRPQAKQSERKVRERTRPYLENATCGLLISSAPQPKKINHSPISKPPLNRFEVDIKVLALRNRRKNKAAR